MDHQLRALRRRIGRTERNARGHRRYDEELRIEIIEYVRRREDDGCSLAEVARDLDLTQRTVWGWVRREEETMVKPVELVDVEPVTPSEGRTLVLPGGSRIEGLSIDDVLALVRALS